MRPPSSAPPEAMPPFFARCGGANRLQICVVLYVHGFPFGTQPSQSFELDLLAHLSLWAPVAHVELLLCPQSGWVTGALASFVHETYAQAVLDSMPYARFYGIYLCMELVHTPATLRFRLAEWGTGVQLRALWGMSARPASLAELVSEHSVRHPRASRRAAFSLSVRRSTHAARRTARRVLRPGALAGRGVLRLRVRCGRGFYARRACARRARRARSLSGAEQPCGDVESAAVSRPCHASVLREAVPHPAEKRPQLGCQ